MLVISIVYFSSQSHSNNLLWSGNSFQNQFYNNFPIFLLSSNIHSKKLVFVSVYHFFSFIITIKEKIREMTNEVFRFNLTLNYCQNPNPNPNPNLNTTVGFDMKMTVQTTPPPTQTFQPLLDQLES